MKYGLKTLITGATSSSNAQPKTPGIRATARKLQLFCGDIKKSDPGFNNWLGNVLAEARAIHHDGGWSCKNISRFQKFYLLKENELRAFALECTKNYDDELVLSFRNCVAKICPGIGVQVKELNYGGDPSGLAYGGGMSISSFYRPSGQVSQLDCLVTRLVAPFCIGSLWSFANEFENAMRVFGKLVKAKNKFFDTSEFFRPAFYPEHAAGNDPGLMLYVYMHAKEGGRGIKPFRPAAICLKAEKPDAAIGQCGKEKKAPQQTETVQHFYPSLPAGCRRVFGSFNDFGKR